MIKDLIKFATHLDSIGLTKEADYVDRLVLKIAQDEDREERLEKRESITISAAKKILNQFFGKDVFLNDPEHLKTTLDEKQSEKLDLSEDEILSRLKQAQNRGDITAQILKCSDEGCMPYCFRTSTSSTEKDRVQAIVKVKRSKDKPEITLEISSGTHDPKLKAL